MTTPNVNVPTNDKQKEADINQKTQLYGIYQAFALGKAPSNKQIDVAINSALAHKAMSNPSTKLSSDGKQLIGDLRNVMEKAKVLFLTKNEGNLLQDFAWQCQQAGTGDATKPGMPVDKETAKQHGNEALEGLRTLGQLIITNGQFRKLLKDASILARDIAGDGAQKAATKVNPSQDQLSQIDDPAEDNTWHEAPDFKGMKDSAKARIPSRQQAKDVAQQQGGGHADDLQQANEEGGAGAAAQTAKDKLMANNHAQDLQQAREEGGTGAAAKVAKNKLSDRIPDEHKQRARDQVNRGKGYLNQKVPEERRKQAIYRLKKMIVEIQGHEDYQRAIDTLLRLAETYHGHGKSVAGDAAGQAKGLLNTAQPALTDLKIILERFANSTSMDDLFDSLNQIYRDADADPELKGWFRDLDVFIRKALKEQGYVLKEESNTEFNQIYDKGNFLLRERYRDHTNRILDEVKFFSNEFDNDPYNKAFAESMNKLFTDLGTDKDGKPEFKPHLLTDLRDVIIPEVINSIRYIPIPDIEFTSTDADVVIRDLVVEADNVIPNIFDLTSDNSFRYGRKGVANANKNKIQIHMSGIQTHLTNIRFYAKSKKGVVLRNWGLLDVILANTGLDFKIKMETADKTDKAHFFKVTDVDVKIKNFKVVFKQQHHPILTKIAALFARGSVLQAPIKKVLEVKIKQAVEDLDAFCYEVYQDVQTAKRDAKSDPANADNVFKQYFNAYQQKVTRTKEKTAATKEKAKAKAQEKEVETNIAFTKDQRISSKWNGGKGIPIDEQEKDPRSGAGKFTLKAQEYKNLALEGQKWESPVFGLGSASETRGLPKVAAISRKPHETAPSQVRGGNHPGASSTTDGASTGAAAMGAGGASGAAGYGAGQGTGAAGYGAGQGTAANYGQTDGSAFNDTSYSQTNGGANGTIDPKSGTAGEGNLGPSGFGSGSTNTTLGTSNPVLSGRF